jgi:hypothetical protein
MGRGTDPSPRQGRTVSRMGARVSPSHALAGGPGTGADAGLSKRAVAGVLFFRAWRQCASKRATPTPIASVSCACSPALLCVLARSLVRPRPNRNFPRAAGPVVGAMPAALARGRRGRWHCRHTAAGGAAGGPPRAPCVGLARAREPGSAVRRFRRPAAASTVVDKMGRSRAPLLRILIGCLRRRDEMSCGNYATCESAKSASIGRRAAHLEVRGNPCLIATFELSWRASA